jgi:DNA-binding transcriptional LysR family regulator
MPWEKFYQSTPTSTLRLCLAYLTEGHAQPHVSQGKLVRVLADWCPPFAGYHLYYPSRRQPSPAFTVLVEALRYKDR